jgi:hypothetical protein
MQTNLRRGKAASRARSAALSVAIAASASIVATFSFFVPNPAQAGCGAPHITGSHAASSGIAGVHTTTGISAPSGGGGGGVGSSGCAVSGTPLRGLTTAASGRVIEGGNVGRREAHTRTGPTQTFNAAAHLHTIKPSHHA